MKIARCSPRQIQIPSLRRVTTSPSASASSTNRLVLWPNFPLFLFDAVFLAQQRFQIQLKCMVITDPYRAGRVSDLHFFILQMLLASVLDLDFNQALARIRKYDNRYSDNAEQIVARLHAGCRLGSLSASPKLIPEDGSAPGFDIV